MTLKVYRMLKSSIKLVDDHYELPLPWKYEDQIMPNNKNLALKRLNHLKQKLMRYSDLKQIFNSNSNNVRQNLPSLSNKPP